MSHSVTVAMQDEECCEEVLLAAHSQSHSKHTALSSAQALLSIDTAGISEEGNNVQSGPVPHTQQPPKS